MRNNARTVTINFPCAQVNAAIPNHITHPHRSFHEKTNLQAINGEIVPKNL